MEQDRSSLCLRELTGLNDNHTNKYKKYIITRLDENCVC